MFSHIFSNSFRAAVLYYNCELLLLTLSTVFQKTISSKVYNKPSYIYENFSKYYGKHPVTNSFSSASGGLEPTIRLKLNSIEGIFMGVYCL